MSESKKDIEKYENEHYKVYFKEKQEIQEKYPRWVSEDITKQNREYDRKVWLEYLKEIADLMLRPNGDFQKYVWDTISESDREVMERNSRPSMQGGRKSNFNYY